MKILYYSPHPHLNLSAETGYATHMREMINAFQERGHTVILVIRGGIEINVVDSIAGEKKVKKLLTKICNTSF